MACCQLVLKVVGREWSLRELAVKVVERWRREKKSEVSVADLNTAAVGEDRCV